LHAGDLASGRAGTLCRSAGQARAAERKLRGFGRCGTDKEGNYAFDTIKPGVVPDTNGKPQAPHILVAVFARGMLRHLYTRIYFGDDAANAADPVLALVPADRRATLIAQREPGKPLYRFDLRLQGDDETVFFDV
jgi:protocatechuate 3,4-dioxygenase alpha subunit